MALLRALSLLLAFLLAAPAGATLLPELDLSSPRAAYGTLLAEIQSIEAAMATYRAQPTRANFTEASRRVARAGQQFFDLSHLPPATVPKEGAANLAYLADILNRLPPAPLDSIPGFNTDAAQMPLRWSIPGTEIRFVRMTEGPRTGDYVISADTVARLPLFHREVMHLPVLRDGASPSWRLSQQRALGPIFAGLPVASLPHALHATVFGTPVWKVVVALAGVVMILIIVVLWMGIVRRWTRNAPRWRRLFLSLTVPALLAVLVEVVHNFNLWELLMQSPLADVEIILATFTLYIAGAWAAWVAWWAVAEAIIASPVFPDDVYDANLLRIVARVGSIGSAAALLIYGASDVGVPGLGVLAGFSIGGVALALAAQSTVENLLGGVSIFADRPFRVGERIRYGEMEGTVETIGPRSTGLRDGDGTLTTVPNADLAKLHITNLTRRATHRFQHRVQLRYGASASGIEALLTALRRLVADNTLIEKRPEPPHVRLVGFGDTAIEIEIRAHIRSGDEAAFLAAQEALILDIIRAVDASGLEFAATDLSALLASAEAKA